MAATGGSSAQPLSVRKRASFNGHEANQHVALLLQQPILCYAEIPAILTWPRNLGQCRDWMNWGTLLNRKVVVRDSTLGPGSGRGLFAGPRDDGFDGFKPKEVITIYGGELLTKRQVDERER